MNEKILDELLKTTFTLDGFRRKYQVLKKKIEAEIYGKDEEGGVEVASVKRRAADDLDKPEDEKPSTQAEGLGSFDFSLLKGIKNDDFVKINETVEQFLKSMETLSIYFVFLPADPQIQEIGKWLRQALSKPRLIFEVKVDQSLIGGCAIAYKGVYRDYSLKAKISGSKEKLLEEFRKYFRQ